MKRKRGFKAGDRVTVILGCAGYYSGYAGNPKLELRPGMPAVIAKTGHAFVRYHTCLLGCVAVQEGVVLDYTDPASGKTERTSTCYANLIRLED